MISPSVLKLLDPAYVVACDGGSDDAWAELLEALDDEQALIGTSTYSRLFEVAANSGPEPQVWVALSPAAGRIASSEDEGGPRGICCAHFPLASGSVQQVESRELLRCDVAEVSATVGIWVAASPLFAGAHLLELCKACAGSGLYVTTNPEVAEWELLVREFFRLGLGWADLDRESERLFPDLLIHPDAFSGRNGIDGDAAWVLETAMHHLSMLNAHGVRIMKMSQPEVRIAEFASLGVEASPESPRVRGDAKAMEVRKFRFVRDSGSGAVSEKAVCEWHTKFSPTNGRIYYSIVSSSIAIGKICGHL